MTNQNPKTKVKAEAIVWGILMSLFCVLTVFFDDDDDVPGLWKDPPVLGFQDLLLDEVLLV